MTKAKNKEGPPGTYVSVNGITMYYESFGNGRPLIFLHGSMSTGNVWKPYIPFLSQHFKLILPDARGHGRTDNPSGSFGVPLLADDFAALIEALELERPSLCGWSMGGDVSLNVARRYPDKVNRLVVGGVTHRVADSYFTSLRAMGLDGPGQVNFERAEKSIPQLIALWQSEHTQSAFHWKELITQLSHEMLKPPPLSEDDLRQIAAPTLVIWGDRDQFLPIENAVALYKLIPNAQLAVIPNADHFVSRSRVEQFAQLAAGFLLS